MAHTQNRFPVFAVLGFLLAGGSGVLVGSAINSGSQAAAAKADAAVCGATAAAQLRTTLYFGMTRPTGAVSELEWQIFLRDEVTRRFPEGLTVWEAQGQWKNARGLIDQERSKVLLVVHPDSSAARASVQEVIEKYQKQFDQESVLWETARVCVAS